MPAVDPLTVIIVPLNTQHSLLWAAALTSDIFLLHIIPAGHPLQLLAKTLGLLSRTFILVLESGLHSQIIPVLWVDHAHHIGTPLFTP